MNQILQNLADPSWWFTGVFFVVFGVILTKIIFNWFPLLWSKFSRLIPVLSKKIYRWNEKQTLMTVKRYRQHEVKINWLIARYWSLSTVTIIYMLFLMIFSMISSSPNETNSAHFSGLNKLSKLLPIVIPAYFLAIITIVEKRILKRTIEEHIKWKNRITKI